MSRIIELGHLANRGKLINTRMKTRFAHPFFVALLFAAMPASASADSPLVARAFDRPGLNLNGLWETIVDPYDVGYLDYRYVPYDRSDSPTGGIFLDRTPRDRSELLEYKFGSASTLLVPRDWNSQDDKLLYYEGTVWYRRHFTLEQPAQGSRLFLCFGGANYEADVYLNGRKLGQHVGGFTPFNFEVTDRVHPGENSLIVRVNNQRLREGVPTRNTDWWNFGGITRDVRLVTVPAAFITDTFIRLRRDANEDRIEVQAKLDGAPAGQAVRVAIPELGVTTDFATDSSGIAQGEIVPKGLVRWSPENPKCYGVTITAGDDSITERMGFRTIETRGHEILLNGKPIFLRGISIHEENPLRGGRAVSREDAQLLLGWAKELNCNFARLAHYPHNEYMARLADEIGLLLWEEVPVYWTIQWDNPGTLANARHQLAELVMRDRNRASVIVWSVANETPVSEARTRFLKTLVDDARALDDTRLVSAAMETRVEPGEPDVKIVDDPFGQYTDLISFNEYVGWYDGLPEKCDRISWKIKYDKPVFISEFGGGALAGFHADALTRFSEEFQEEVYRHTLPMLERIPAWRGATPWILTDFHSPRRLLPGIQDGWNRKGLIGQNGERKKAFYVLRAFYAAKAAGK